MNPTTNPIILDVVVNALREQSWYRAHANTVNSGVALLASVLAFIATLDLAHDPRTAGILALAIQLVGVVAVRLTRNGLSLSTAEQLSTAQPPAPSVTATGSEWSDLVNTATGRHRVS